MVRRTAGCLALLAFAVCLLAGLNAGNSAATVLSRALLAMGATFGVGLVVGTMAQKMLDENVAAEAVRTARLSDGATGAATGAGARPPRVEKK